METSFITRADLCSQLGITPGTARRWERRGRLTPLAFSTSTIRYRADEVARLVEAARTTTRRKPGPRPKVRNTGTTYATTL